jgi:hypothetical protein
MTVMRAATMEWLLANPPTGEAFSGLKLTREDGDEAADNPFMDTLVYLDMGLGNISAIYIDDGTEVTGRNYLYDELDEYVANGGSIEGYTP